MVARGRTFAAAGRGAGRHGEPAVFAESGEGGG